MDAVHIVGDNEFEVDLSDPIDQQSRSELLQDLPEKLAQNWHYPFRADVLRELVLVKESAAYRWSTIKTQLKDARVALTDLSAAMATERKRLRAERAHAQRNRGNERQTEATQGRVRIGQYEVIDHQIHRWKDTEGSEIPIPLCNFDARITKEILRDDGANIESSFVIEGTRATGEALGRTEVPFSEFATLSWITRSWGNRAFVAAGISNRDHLRAAIQALSGTVERQTIYGHTGWRQLDGEWRYLHGGGALGATDLRADIEVDAGAGHMRHYRLPEPPGDIRAAVQVSLRLLDIASQNPAVGAGLVCAVYRAPLAEYAPIDVSLFLTGQTGTQKSETTALALQHFGGEFSARAIPGNWFDTVTDLEMKAHAAKDTVFVIDDFKPNGRPKQEADKLHSLADRIFRGVGNGSGRGRRMTSLKQRPDYPARGFVLASGEDLPKWQSCRARLAIVEMRPGDVDKAVLTELQRAGRSGLLAQAMTAYLQWLAPQIQDLKTELKEILIEERDKAIQAGLHGDHDRIPDNVAQLLAGARILARFAAHAGAVDAGILIERIRNAVYSTARAQGEHLADQDEISRFFALLGSALSSQRVHVLDLHTLAAPKNAAAWGWQVSQHQDDKGNAEETAYPRGNPVGWLDREKLYLDADAAFAAVVTLARDQGESFTINQNTLWQRLADKGLLAERDQESRGGKVIHRARCRKTIAGTRRKGLVCVFAKYLQGGYAPSRGPSGPETSKATDAAGCDWPIPPEQVGIGPLIRGPGAAEATNGPTLEYHGLAHPQWAKNGGGPGRGPSASPATQGLREDWPTWPTQKPDQRPTEIFESNTPAIIEGSL